MTRRCTTALVALLIMVPLLWGFDPFRTSNTEVEEGNAKLGAGKHKQALSNYDQAAKELPDSAGVQYNRGIALSRLNKLKEARTALIKGTTAADPALKQKSFYNLGNVQLKLKQPKQAVDAYRRALQLDPGHVASKWNLEIALRRLKEEQKKKKKQQQKKDKQDKQNKKDQQQKDQQNKQQGDKQPKPKPKSDKKDPDKKKDRGKKQQPKQGDKQQPKPSPSKRQMNSVLDALDRNDRNLQRRRARMRGRGLRRPTKDW
jgi:Ca-activated chloride channel family protein